MLDGKRCGQDHDKHIDQLMKFSIENCRNLDSELEWLAGIIQYRVQQLSEGDGEAPMRELPSPPRLREENSAFALFVIENGLQAPERLVLVLSMVAHLRPELRRTLLKHFRKSSRKN